MKTKKGNLFKLVLFFFRELYQIVCVNVIEF